MHLGLPNLADLAPILWAKWGNVFLETLRQEALDAEDGLAFRAVNSQAGIRTLLVVCTIARAQIRTAEDSLSLGAVARPVDWERYSAAEIVLKTDKASGLSHQEQRDDSGRTALVLCATRPASVQTLERVFDLPE